MKTWSADTKDALEAIKALAQLILERADALLETFPTPAPDDAESASVDQGTTTGGPR